MRHVAITSDILHSLSGWQNQTADACIRLLFRHEALDMLNSTALERGSSPVWWADGSWKRVEEALHPTVRKIEGRDGTLPRWPVPGCGAIAAGICIACVWEGEGLLTDAPPGITATMRDAVGGKPSEGWSMRLYRRVADAGSSPCVLICKAIHGRYGVRGVSRTNRTMASVQK